MKQSYDELYQTALEQNREIVRLKEEVRQAKHLLSLYEACITKGVKIDFPNSSVKGGNADNTGTRCSDVGFDGETTIDFDDF